MHSKDILNSFAYLNIFNTVCQDVMLVLFYLSLLFIYFEILICIISDSFERRVENHFRFIRYIKTFANTNLKQLAYQIISNVTVILYNSFFRLAEKLISIHCNYLCSLLHLIICISLHSNFFYFSYVFSDETQPCLCIKTYITIIYCSLSKNVRIRHKSMRKNIEMRNTLLFLIVNPNLPQL